MTKPAYRYHPFFFWMMNHLRAILFATGEMIRSPFSTLITLLVIGIAMSLPIGFYLGVKSIEKIGGYWNGSPSLSIYLEKNLPPLKRSIIDQKLQADPDIEKIQYISPEQGLKQFESTLQVSSVLSFLSENPLPGVYIITPHFKRRQPEQLNQLSSRLQHLQGISKVEIDHLWVERLYYLTTVATRLCFMLAALFGLGVILITGNTLRLSLQSHRQTVLVLKLIGAKKSYILRPILYRGCFYGFLGGVTAWVLVGLMWCWLQPPLFRLLMTYSNQYATLPLNFSFLLTTILLCSALGLLGAWLAAHRYLQEQEVLN